MNILDLYSGPGGLGTGFSDFFDIIDAVDHYRPACNTYRHNHGDTRVHEQDVGDYINGLVPRDYDGIVGMIGGPPCDDFSVLNRNADPGSKRAMQIITMARAVIQLKPIFALIENVTRVPKHLKDRIISMLERAGYHVVARQVRACDFGSVQIRRRWILTACRRRSVYPVKTVPRRTAAEILTGEESEIAMTAEIAEMVRGIPSGKWAALPGRAYKAYFVVDPRRLMPAVVNPTKLRYVRPDRIGYLSFAELIRAQGFPDGYSIHGNSTEIGRQIAQAVPVEMARAFARAFHEVVT